VYHPDVAEETVAIRPLVVWRGGHVDPARCAFSHQQKQGSWASTTFQDQYMPQMDPMTKASWERASSNSKNIEAAAANWAEGRKATPPTGPN